VAANANERVSKDGLALLFQKLGSKITEEEIDELIKELGIDCEGNLEYPTVLKMLVILATRRKKGPSMEDVKVAFSIYDKDESGFITKNEIRCVVFGLGLPIDEIVLEQKLTQCDVNDDKKVSIDEFGKYLDELKESLE